MRAIIQLRTDSEIRIVRFYEDGHVPLPLFEEQVADDFDEMCKWYGDDPARCQTHGKAFWAYMRLGPPPRYRATIKTDLFPGSDPVTMIKVYRKRGK